MDDILTVKYNSQVDKYVAKCQLPPIYSQGTTNAEALKASESAVKLFVETFFNK